ncbi:MAG: hypothetical protein IPL96_04380 [Holophagaceae bacterium]|nr:hypothetical protein [Holophagaceae bacterium]
MAKVEVPKGLLIGLASALGAALLALAFLLGRAAGARMQPGSAPGVAPGIQDARPAGAVQAAQPGGGAMQAGPPTSLPPAPAALVPAGPSDPQDPQRGAVAAYFAALDRIAPGQLAGDPQAVAQEVVAGLAKGDASGFDRLLAQADEARRRVAALVPPPPCAAFHQESLALLDENLVLLRSVKRSLEGGEGEGGMASLVARAQAVQARSEGLERADKALRARYGAGPK